MEVVEDLEELREIYGPPGERSVKKQLSRLDKHCRDFIARHAQICRGQLDTVEAARQLDECRIAAPADIRDDALNGAHNIPFGVARTDQCRKLAFEI